MPETTARPVRRPRLPGFFRLYGGKAKLAPWIVSNLPPHDGYVEPFCGGAHVLCAKPRVKMEVINDLDKGVWATFKAARDCPDQLARALRLTPYARQAHREAAAVAKAGYDVELLTAATSYLCLVGQQMFAMSAPMPWRQPASHRVLAGPQSTWTNLPDVVEVVAERLRGVAIECRPALDVIRYTDHPRVLMYLDPPYLPATCDCSGYRQTMTRADHEELTAELLGLQSMVVLSGYDHADYANWLPGWQSLRCQTIASTAAAASRGKRSSVRTEVLWFNPAAWDARRAAQG